MSNFLEDNLDEKLFFLPSQLIQHKEFAILRRGVVKIKVAGQDIFEIIKVIMVLASEEGASGKEIFTYFGTGLTEEIKILLDELRLKGFIVTQEQKDSLGTTSNSGNKKTELFYWNIGCTAEKRTKLEQTQFRILGVNYISRQLAKVFEQSGIKNVQIIDYPLLRNLDFFGDDGLLIYDNWQSEHQPTSFPAWLEEIEFEEFDCLICTSDFGGMYALRELNEFCVDNQTTFFPVVLQDLNGYIGPLIIPGDTCCYECFLQRQNTNLVDYETKRTIELSDYEGQEAIGFHPAMASSLADIAAFELVKFYAGLAQARNVGKLIHLNLLNTQVKTIPILKNPRCSVCSNVVKVSTTTIYKTTFVPTHYE